MKKINKGWITLNHLPLKDHQASSPFCMQCKWGMGKCTSNGNGKGLKNENEGLPK